MSGNGYGNVRVTREANMAAYDTAPPPLRWLMRNAVSPYSAVHMVRLYWDMRQKNGLSHRDAVALATQRGQEVDRAETLKAYGPTHPEAGGARRDH